MYSSQPFPPSAWRAWSMWSGRSESCELVCMWKQTQIYSNSSLSWNMLLWDRKPMAFPCSHVRPPATSGVVCRSCRPLRISFLPWSTLIDWSLMIRTQPCLRKTWRFSIILFSLTLLFGGAPLLHYFPLYFFLSLIALITDWESSCHLQLLLSCSFMAYPTFKPPTPSWWSQWRKSMLVTGMLLELKLTTLGKFSDNLDVGVVVFKSSGQLFVNASGLPLVFSECLNMRRVWLNCPHYWCRYFSQKPDYPAAETCRK